MARKKSLISLCLITGLAALTFITSATQWLVSKLGLFLQYDHLLCCDARQNFSLVRDRTSGLLGFPIGHCRLMQYARVANGRNRGMFWSLATGFVIASRPHSDSYAGKWRYSQMALFF